MSVTDIIEPKIPSGYQYIHLPKSFHPMKDTFSSKSATTLHASAVMHLVLAAAASTTLSILPDTPM